MSNIYCINLSTPRKFLLNTIDEMIFNYRMQSNTKINKEKAVLKIIVSTCVAGIVVQGVLLQGGVVLASTDAVPCMAIVSNVNIGVKIARAFQPLIEVLQGVSVPLVTMVEMGGAITMSFNKRKGVKIMKDGAIAFLVVQFVPALVNILVEVGKAMQ